MPLEYALQFRGLFPDPGPWKLPKSIMTHTNPSLGIARLPEQLDRRLKRHPHTFNVMVVGESGLGKTTFMNTLFNVPLKDQILYKNLSDHKTVKIEKNTYELEEEGVRVLLTVVDTPGFGDSLNSEKDFEPIIQYIDEQYENYLTAEKAQNVRRKIPDSRIHALLYFLPPTGRQGLRDLDLEFMQKLCTKVNVIPIIAKADSLAPDEAITFKKAILKDFEKYDIRHYPTHYAEDRDYLPNVESFIPFTVIGADTMVEVDGKSVRGRQYRWGSVQVDNPEHCDFIHLRELLIRTNLLDLIETTHAVHYLQYRAVRIRGKGRPESFLACDDFYESRIENAKRALAEEMQRKEDAMRQRFVAKVREKEQSLREREEALNQTRQRMMDELESLRRAVEAEEAALNEIVANRGR